MTKPNLLKSRKFWIMITDAGFATLATVLGALLAPDKLAYIMGIVAIWQPVVYAVIRGITEEDAAAMAAGLIKPQ